MGIGRDPATGSVDIRAAYMEDLAEALRSEAALLGDLSDILHRQRAAVAQNDVAALEASIGTLARTLLTAGEHRERRSVLMERITGNAEDTLDAPALGTNESLPAEFLEARAELRRVGASVAQDLAINRYIVSRAMRMGEELIQRLFSGVAGPEDGYAELEGGRPAMSGGVLVNRRA